MYDELSHLTHRKGQAVLIGRAEIPISELWKEDLELRWYPLKMENPEHARTCPKAALCISAKYICASQSRFKTEVPRCAFPQRHGCGVRLYADAHNDPHHQPDIATADGAYQSGDLWNEMYAAMEEAVKFIYIAGWSVWADLQMVRDGASLTLGELLIKKAKEVVMPCGY